jgi:hypothetical protein
MVAKIRAIAPQFLSTHTSRFKKLLVNGCSYTWNNSESTAVTWPYYLRDMAGFDQVYDCSQGGSGSSHIFHSTINEIETNQNISPEDTLIVINWSGLHRVDVISQKNTDIWIDATNHAYNFYLDNRYCYFDNFITLPFFRPYQKSKTLLDDLVVQFYKIVSDDGQIIASATQILALFEYLKNKKYTTVFLYFETTLKKELAMIKNDFLSNAVISKIADVKSIGEYANEKLLRIPGDGHPSPDAHLGWTKEHLIPYLESNNLIEKL